MEDLIILSFVKCYTKDTNCALFFFIYTRIGYLWMHLSFTIVNINVMIISQWNEFSVSLCIVGRFHTCLHKSWLSPCVCFQGSTTTENTGPSGAQDGSSYMYLESSAPHIEGDYATLTSSAVTFTESTYKALSICKKISDRYFVL